MNNIITIVNYKVSMTIKNAKVKAHYNRKCKIEKSKDAHMQKKKKAKATLSYS